MFKLWQLSVAISHDTAVSVQVPSTDNIRFQENPPADGFQHSHTFQPFISKTSKST